MLRYMLDTNICIRALRNPDGAIRDHFVRLGSISAISTVTLHELIHGSRRTREPETEREKIDNLAAGLEVLNFDAHAAEQSGDIHAALTQSGQIIGAYDMLIAGHARSLGLIVVTNNLREFARVDGLRCEDWL